MRTFPATYSQVSRTWQDRTLRLGHLRDVFARRVAYWKLSALALHAYGSDGEGRHKVRVIYPADGQNDLLGGAFRSVRTFEEVMKAAAARGETYNRDGHSGWYTDPDGCTSRDGSGLCWGVVAYLGHSRWLAGYVLGGSDCGGYHLDRIYSSELDAARAADEIARIVAETEYEYQQKYQEAQAQALEDEINAGLQSLRKALALRNDRRECFAGMRAEARQLMETIRDKRDTLRTDFAGVL